MPAPFETVRDLLTTPAFHQWLGLDLLEMGDGTCTIGMRARPELTADVAGSYIHGGILGTLLDVAGDFALVSQLGVGLPTIDLRVDYLRPARPEDELRASATVVRRGRSLGVADSQVATTEGKLLAVGRGVYSTAVTGAGATG